MAFVFSFCCICAVMSLAIYNSDPIISTPVPDQIPEKSISIPTIIVLTSSAAQMQTQALYSPTAPVTPTFTPTVTCCQLPPYPYQRWRRSTHKPLIWQTQHQPLRLLLIQRMMTFPLIRLTMAVFAHVQEIHLVVKIFHLIMMLKPVSTIAIHRALVIYINWTAIMTETPVRA